MLQEAGVAVIVLAALVFLVRQFTGGSGKPKKAARPNTLIASGMTGMARPSANSSAMPLHMLSVASVMMNGCGSRPKT